MSLTSNKEEKQGGQYCPYQNEIPQLDLPEKEEDPFQARRVLGTPMDDIVETLKVTHNEEKHKSNTIELRENLQYGTDTEIDDNRLSELKQLCQKAIEETKKIIYEN